MIHYHVAFGNQHPQRSDDADLSVKQPGSAAFAMRCGTLSDINPTLKNRRLYTASSSDRGASLKLTTLHHEQVS